MTGKTLLLVEDDLYVQDFNTQLLEHEGFTVATATTLSEAQEKIKNGLHIDIIILDIGMPDGSGFEFLQSFRKNSNIPVLILTGYISNEDIIKGFQNGCDDYLTKPYEFKVLLVRIQNLLKHAAQVPDRIITGSNNDIIIEVLHSKAYINGVDLMLGEKKEFALFVFFVQHENEVLKLEHIYENIWGMPLNNNSTALRNAIKRLRDKLKDSGYTIESAYGSGYYFESCHKVIEERFR